MLIRPLTVDDEAEALAAVQELAPFEFLLDTTPGQPWDEYVARLDEIARGENLAPDRVRMLFLVAEVDGVVAARTSIRFELTDWLLAYGGHVGYGVRPAFRRSGIATALLRASLVELAADGTDRALVVCDDGNVASAATIERCGGVFEGLGEGPPGHGPQRRYWVPTA